MWRDESAGSFWAELGGEPAARPAPETPPQESADQGKCFVCGKPGHYAVACRLHPARLRKIRGEACGPGPCTNACRAGDHNDCGYAWCACCCHEFPL